MTARTIDAAELRAAVRQAYDAAYVARAEWLEYSLGDPFKESTAELLERAKENSRLEQLADVALRGLFHAVRVAVDRGAL